MIEQARRKPGSTNYPFCYRDPFVKLKALFSRAPRAASRLDPEEALPNSFSERNDYMMILWSDSLK